MEQKYIYLTRDKVLGYDEDKHAQYYLWYMRPKRVSDSVRKNKTILWCGENPIGMQCFSDDDIRRLGMPRLSPGQIVKIYVKHRVHERPPRVKKKKKKTISKL